ncbi:MAG: sigma-70 family RNA polymerase sigma factor [Lacunisphaera sp.]
MRFLPLVRNVVDRIKLTLPPHIDADDLYSVGVTGLIAAVRKYNPEQGNTFAGYAATRIRGAILDELRRLDWCPRRARARARKLKESINDLEQRLGRTATEDEICEGNGRQPGGIPQVARRIPPRHVPRARFPRHRRGVGRCLAARVSGRRERRHRPGKTSRRTNC